MRLTRKERFVRLLRDSDVVYVPKYAFPVIPAVEKLGKKVVVHLHDYIPVVYTAVVMAPYEKHKHSIAKDDIALECMKSLKHCAAARALWWLPRLAKRWVGQADKVICVSHRQAEIISKLAPELAHRLKVVYNPIPNVPPLEKRLENPTFLYLGGDSYIKGFHVLLEVSQKLLKNNLRASFILAGKYESSKQIIGRLGRNFNLIGFVRHENILKLYSSSFAVLFPSIVEEPLPYAVLEAMLTGTIPIASRVGGVPEIVEGTYAKRMLFTPGNSDEMADKMQEVLSLSKDQLIDIGLSLRKNVLKRFNNETIRRQLLEVFEA
jgi:glycosyltransferase involved in cell wall biosynthesis